MVGPDENLGGIEMYSYVSGAESVNGATTFAIQNGVTWNDTIDPNGIYTSDRIKSFFAEAGTIGKAQDYQLPILLTFETEHVVPSGGRSRISAWPF